MLRSLKSVLDVMRADTAISSELPKARSLVIRALIWLFIGEMISVVRFLPQKYFIDELLGNQDVQTLGLIAISVVVLHAAATATLRQTFIYQHMADYRMWMIWWSYGHRRELLLSTDWHTRHGTGEKESLVGKNIMKFEQMVDTFIFNTVPASVRILLTIIFFAFLYWPLALVMTLATAVYCTVVWRSERRARDARRAQQKGFKKLERFGTQLNQTWRTIKYLGLEDEFANRNHSFLESFVKQQANRIRLYASNMHRQFTVIDLAKLPLYGVLIYGAVYNQISVGTITLGLTWSNQAFAHLNRFSDLQRSMNEGVEALRELLNVLQVKPSIQIADAPEWPSQPQGSIEFQGVSFAYNGDDQHAVRDVSFKLRPHTTTALIGRSGAGKSTLTSLLLREYDPCHGSILIDGVELKNLDYERYRREMVAIVPQAIQLFDATIMDNIRLSRLDASDEEVIAAAKAAHAHEFIMDIDDGYQAHIGENGIRLSGGQRQRLAIAQALLRQPNILILDEATSALDAESQARVQETLEELTRMRKMTIVIIAHRLSTIRGADEVIVMDNGGIAERGTHEQLQQLQGLYTKLRQEESA